MTKKDNQVHCICMNHNKWGLDNAFAYMNRLLHSWYLFLSGKMVLAKQASQDRVEFMLIHAVDLSITTDGSLEQWRLTWPETHQDLLGLSWDLWPLRMTFLWSHKDDPPQRSFLLAIGHLILLSPSPSRTGGRKALETERLSARGETLSSTWQISSVAYVKGMDNNGWSKRNADSEHFPTDM